MVYPLTEACHTFWVIVPLQSHMPHVEWAEQKNQNLCLVLIPFLALGPTKSCQPYKSPAR